MELLIVTALLGVGLGSLALVSKGSGQAYDTGTSAAFLEQRTAAAMEKIVTELQLGMQATASDPGDLGAEELTYAHAEGLVGSNVVESPQRRIAFEYEDGELDDGLDNNGNGLVDEGRVVLWEDFGGPEERRRVLTRWVTELFAGETANGLDDNGNGLIDERGFCVVRQGDAYVVRLSLRRVDTRGRVLVRTAQSAVRMRN